MKSVSTAMDLTKFLPLLILMGGVGLPATAHAVQGSGSFGGSDRGEFGSGEAPIERTFSIEELQRMNQDTLVGLAVSHFGRFDIHGEMGRYNFSYVVRALRRMPEPTSRLINRIEDANTDQQKLEIIDWYLKQHKQDYDRDQKLLADWKKTLEDEGLLTRRPFLFGGSDKTENVRVTQYYELLRASAAQGDFIKLLDNMRRVITWKY